MRFSPRSPRYRLVLARTWLVRITTELSKQNRGIMKTFGLLVPAGKVTFEKNARRLYPLRGTCRAADVGGMAAFASVSQSLGANASQVHVRARHAACSCRSLAWRHRRSLVRTMVNFPREASFCGVKHHKLGTLRCRRRRLASSSSENDQPDER